MDGFTVGGGGGRMDVENSIESHKPVEIVDLRSPSDSWSGDELAVRSGLPRP